MRGCVLSQGTVAMRYNVMYQVAGGRIFSGLTRVVWELKCERR